LKPDAERDERGEHAEQTGEGKTLPFGTQVLKAKIRQFGHLILVPPAYSPIHYRRGEWVILNVSHQQVDEAHNPSRMLSLLSFEDRRFTWPQKAMGKPSPLTKPRILAISKPEH
jgi:hypothetical protein